MEIELEEIISGTVVDYIADKKESLYWLSNKDIRERTLWWLKGKDLENFKKLLVKLGDECVSKGYLDYAMDFYEGAEHKRGIANLIPIFVEKGNAADAEECCRLTGKQLSQEQYAMLGNKYAEFGWLEPALAACERAGTKLSAEQLTRIGDLHLKQLEGLDGKKRRGDISELLHSAEKAYQLAGNTERQIQLAGIGFDKGNSMFGEDVYRSLSNLLSPKELVKIGDERAERGCFDSAKEAYNLAGKKLSPEQCIAIGDKCFGQKRFIDAMYAYIGAGRENTQNKLLAVGNKIIEEHELDHEDEANRSYYAEKAYRAAGESLSSEQFTNLGNRALEEGWSSLAQKLYEKSGSMPSPKELATIGNRALKAGWIGSAIEAYRLAGIGNVGNILK